MAAVAITGTGLYTPPFSISNTELVDSFNAWVRQYNQQHAEAIADGSLAPKAESSAEFIYSASGINSRYVVDKEGILDINRMRPNLRARSNEEASISCEMAVSAARAALAEAGREASDVDAIIIACSNMPRPYPALAVEVQNALGINGWAYDMNVACASAPFGLQAAADAIKLGHAQRCLVISPEVCSAHLNFSDRDSHFIFGDACTAVLMEASDDLPAGLGWDVVSTKLATQFSNNIRNNFGFLNRAENADPNAADKLFIQHGRKVFKDVVTWVNQHIQTHLGELDLNADQLSRLWLHQANLAMNKLIAKKVLGREPSDAEMPIALDRYANTSSAGSIIAFNLYQDDLAAGDLGIICAFGAGYSCGSAVVKKR